MGILDFIQNLSNQNKIHVEFIHPVKNIEKDVKFEGNKLIVIEETDRSPSYSPTFTKESILVEKVVKIPFLWEYERRKVMLVFGAERCIDFKFEQDKSLVNIPFLDFQTIKNLFKANVVKTAGNIHSTIEIPLIVYLLLGLILLVSIYNASGGSIRI